MRVAIAAAVIALAACRDRGKREHADPPPSPPSTDMRDAQAADASTWPQLADYPHAEPARVIAIPTRTDVPRFDVGGPVIVGDLAIISSSQFGFAAVDYRRGTIAWSKPAGLHVAPPLLAHGQGDSSSIVLVGECLSPPAIADTDALLGCLRVVTPTGADQAYIAIRGKPREVEPFLAAVGLQSLWSAGDHAVRWRRGEAAVTIDLMTGIARPASIEPPPIVVEYRDRRWEIRQVDGRIVASGKPAWRTEHPYTAVLGPVWLPEQSPALRVVHLGAFSGTPEVRLLDMDATGSLRAAIARPTPGISLLGWGIAPAGDAAIAVRMDRSIQRDFVVGYAANAMLMWVYALPEVPRADPVGVAVAPDAVVVFHDGDTLTILPELLAPPTSPGAGRGSSQNPTP
ncbi:MAG: hypothetical protein H0T89_26520 [Deltaproteobacteria bacterium]|nr:hypothetical protein [Deltaproteobacteria bacterium]MDQ3296949.1 hypothetical protein [Myxococcota bacterium]